jgi:hypothetical protein
VFTVCKQQLGGGHGARALLPILVSTTDHNVRTLNIRVHVYFNYMHFSIVSIQRVQDVFLYTYEIETSSILYTRDGQLEVTRGPIFRKFKSSGPKHRKKRKKEKRVIQNMNFN